MGHIIPTIPTSPPPVFLPPPPLWERVRDGHAGLLSAKREDYCGEQSSMEKCTCQGIPAALSNRLCLVRLRGLERS